MNLIDTAVVKLVSRVPQALPTPCPTQPPGTAGVTDIMGWVMWGGLVLCIIGIMVGGALMWTQSRRGEGSDNINKILYGCLGAIVIGAAAGLIGFLAGGANGCA